MVRDYLDFDNCTCINPVRDICVWECDGYEDGSEVKQFMKIVKTTMLNWYSLFINEEMVHRYIGLEDDFTPILLDARDKYIPKEMYDDVIQFDDEKLSITYNGVTKFFNSKENHIEWCCTLITETIEGYIRMDFENIVLSGEKL